MKRSSSDTRKLRGNPSGKKIAPEVVGVGDVWSPPSWFKKALRDKWDYAIANAPRGLLTGTDKDVLAAWCITCVQYDDAARKLSKMADVVIETTNGILVPHPLFNMMNAQLAHLVRLSDKLGFNPSARASLSARGAAIVGPGAQLIEGSVVSFIEEKPDRLDA